MEGGEGEPMPKKVVRRQAAGGRPFFPQTVTTTTKAGCSNKGACY